MSGGRDDGPAGPGSGAAAAATYWLDGVRSTIVLRGAESGGRIALLEEELPRGTASPLHSHPEDETWLIVEGEATFWIGSADDPRRCGPGEAIFAAGGVPHALRVDSERARMLVISTPAGLERWVEQLGTTDPAAPPPSRPQVRAVAAALGVVVHGPVPGG